MSLILEALRKSEAERRRGSAPDLLQADVVPSPAASRPMPWWVWAALVLLALPLLAWWQRGSDAGMQSPATPIPVQTRPAAPPGPPPAPALPAVERLRPAPPPPPIAATPAPEAGPIPLGALSPERRKSLPPLRLSMHLWNEVPARRVAILDGKRVAEGDRIGAARVAEIRHDGVVLDQDGELVLVPLP